jgi:predicted amidohydrolase
MAASATVKIAISQLCSTSSKAHNLAVVRDLVSKAASKGCKMVFLPECFSLMSTSSKMTIEESEAVPDGDTVREVSSIARENKVWISGGSIHERADEVEEGKVWNTGFVVDDMGEFRGKYR